MRLLDIKKSTRAGKKFVAQFDDGTSTHFGATGYGDYTTTGDKKKRMAYRSRHIKDLDTGDPTRAGYLSYYILWGDHKDINKNIKDFKKKFKL
tara:strand:+ start:362 stop:640 length:279 start_codon:yes stop_codon:yes gene_type:complete